MRGGLVGLLADEPEDDGGGVVEPAIVLLYRRRRVPLGVGEEKGGEGGWGLIVHEKGYNIQTILLI